MNEPGQIRVMLILTTREVLDRLYEDVKALGLSPLFADYEDSANNLDHLGYTYNLLPELIAVLEASELFANARFA